MSSVDKNANRPITVVCARCDVTWRGATGDECWSCGEAALVEPAVRAPVRLVAQASTAHRRAG